MPSQHRCLSCTQRGSSGSRSRRRVASGLAYRVRLARHGASRRRPLSAPASPSEHATQARYPALRLHPPQPLIRTLYLALVCSPGTLCRPRRPHRTAQYIESVTVEYAASRAFLTSHYLSWPCAVSQTGTVVDLSRTPAADGTTAHKLFATFSSHGSAALYRQQLGQGIVFRQDPAILPCLGIWVSAGTWPSDDAKRQ